MQRKKQQLAWLKKLLGLRDADSSQLLSILSAAGNEKLPEDEKAALWTRIEAGMKRPVKRRIRPMFWKAAAAVILTAGATWLLWPSSPTQQALVAYAMSLPADSNLTETQLSLGAQRNILLPGKQTQLRYSDSGAVQSGDARYVQDNQHAFNTLNVPFGRIAKVTLQDGTQVWLNAGSRLVYPATFSNHAREVYVSGEAYFEVAANNAQPFKVYTGDVTVNVLGTSFNVSAYEQEAQAITLVSGKVNVEAGAAQVTLTPGEQVSYAAQQQPNKISGINTDAYTSWKDGIIIADHTPLHAILKKLSRYYNHTIIVNGQSGGDTFSGRLDLQKSLDEVLNTIGQTTDMDINRQAGRIILESKR